MTAVKFEFDAELRPEQGGNASRRYRLQGKVPGVVYGGKEAPQAILLDHNMVNKTLKNEAVFSHVLKLNCNGKKQDVVLKAVQRHPYKAAVLHMDFQRVKDTDTIQMRVPLHFLNSANAPGLKKGGIINHLYNEVEVRCLARDLPEFIELDLSQLELDQSIYLSELKLPKGVTLVALLHDQDAPVVSLHQPRQVEEEQPVATEAATAAPTAATAAASGTAAKTPAAPTKDKESKTK